MAAGRGQFSTRSGFILAAAGSAVGLGNIWGFPTKAAENGGGAFVVMYFALAFCLAYPALMAELIIGRHAKANMVTALEKISSTAVSKRIGILTGMCGVITAGLILSFYGIVAGWMMAFMLEPVANAAGLAETAQWLTGFGDARNLLFCALFILLTCGVISAGVEQGIEAWSSRLMPVLLLLLAGLITYVLFQEGAITGLKVYLIPDFGKLLDPALIVSALGQAFFSLSLGVGTMLIYGSYLKKEENLPAMGAMVTLIDTSIAFLAGLLILPAMFVAQQQGVTITSNGSLLAGPDLIFQTLPTLFHSMGAAGTLVGFTFFTLMSIAALTSSISMLEAPVAYVIERHRLGRPSATLLIGCSIFAVSAIIALNFDRLFGFIVTATTEYSQPLLGLMLCIFAAWVWHRDHVLEEIRNGHPEVEHSLFWKIWPGYVRYCCPLLIAATFAQSFIG